MDIDLNFLDNIFFDAQTGLIPAIIQDETSKKVLMLAYMNLESLKLSVETGETWFFSRKRQRLWHKGETSGNIQKIKAIHYDCDGDTLLITVDASGPACHTREMSCFYRMAGDKTTQLLQSEIITQLFSLICQRQANPVENSYTSYLFSMGIDKILKKVGEEAAEVIISAKNQSRESFLAEMADLTYHLLVLLAQKESNPDDVKLELIRRFGSKKD